MKRILPFLLLCICFTAQAQTGSDIAYYYRGKKIALPVSSNRVVMQLKSATNNKSILGRLASTLGVTSDSLITLPQQNLLTVKTKLINSPAAIKQLTLSLQKQGYVNFIHPCLVASSGKEVAYGDQLIVKLQSTVSQSAFKSLLTKFQCTLVRPYPFASGVYVLSAGAANKYDPVKLSNQLFETGYFQYAEPDWTLLDGLLSDPNDPLYAYQWEHKNTGSPAQYSGSPGADMSIQQAWNIATGAGIKVAVIDEGVDTGHADLKANLLQGFDCLSGTSNPGDGRPLGPARAHGTNCTGIIAAVANNSIGIAGIAPDSKIIPINLSAANGAFTSEINIAAGFDYAWQHGADVISNSWGGGTPSSVIDDAINRAVTLGRGGKGSVVLFASGNNNAGLSYPASNDQVISVGGVNMCGQRKSPFSCDGEYWGACYGTGLDVVAPCVKIVSTDLSGSAGYNTAPGAAGDYFFTFNGTSSATPAAAGVVALILSANNNLTATQVRSILENTCDKLPGYTYSMVSGQPNGTWNYETGHGRVDAYTAVQAAQSGNYCSVQIKAAGATRLCAGGSVLLSVVSPDTTTSYQWRKDGAAVGTGTSLTAMTSGSYDLVAIATNGCTATAAPITVTILGNTPALTAFAGIDTLICAGNSVRLGSSQAASGGAPGLADKRVYGMDWQSNCFLRFSLADPLHFDTVAKHMVSDADFLAGYFFSGGDFTPYGYYAITEGTNKLVKVDTATGAQQLIGIAPAPAGFTWSGLAWDPTTSLLYALASSPTTSKLCVIHPLTAMVSTAIDVPVAATEWIAIANNGDAYVMSDNNYIYKVDKATGAAVSLPTFVGTNVIYEQDADFDPVDNSLYLTTILLAQNYASDLRLANTTTGSTTIIGSLGGISEIDATAIAGYAYQYQWSPATGLSSNDVSLPIATPLHTTTYSLSVKDMCGNTATSQVTVHVSEPPPAVITAATDSICVSEKVTLHTATDSAYNYQWYVDGNAIAGATDSAYTATLAGSYRVRIVNGACDSFSVPFLVKSCELRLNDNSPVATCATYFYDSGGMQSGYANGEAYVKTVTAATPGALLRFNLYSFNTEAGNDVLKVYDGPDTLSPLLASLSGIPAMPMMFTAVSGKLTFQFSSNGTVNGPGWIASLQCYQPAVYRSSRSGNADSISTWEVKAAGIFIPAIDLPHVYDDSIIIRSGHTVTVSDSLTADQVWVQAGATLQINAALNLHDGVGTDLLGDGSIVVGSNGGIVGAGTMESRGLIDNSASVNSNIRVQTIIDGSSTQQIIAGGSFQNVTISNPSVAVSITNGCAMDSLTVNNANGLTIVNGTSLNIVKHLSLQSGRIMMKGGSVMDISANADLQGGNAQSFVAGSMQVHSLLMSDSLHFPMGDTAYRPVTLSLTHSIAGASAYQATVVDSALSINTLPTGISAVSNKRFVRVQKLSALPLANAAMTMSYGSDDGVTDSANLRIVTDNGTASWTNIGGVGTASGSGSITSTINTAGAGIFVLANANGGRNSFAMRWLNVDAMLSRNQVNVDWIIENENNIAQYSVERSTDGISFTAIGSVAASAHPAFQQSYLFIDRLPETGINYYRIQQKDASGSTHYSKTVSVTVTSGRDFVIWPNPAKSVVNIQARQNIERIKCYTINGQLLYDSKPANTGIIIPVQRWAAGIYHVEMLCTDGKLFKGRFVKIGD